MISRLWWAAGVLALVALAFSRSARAQNVLLDVLGQRMYLSIPGMDVLKSHEGYSPVPYNDQAGFPTIGYGHKILEGESFDSIDDAQATALLAADIRTAEDAVNAEVRGAITQAQFDALVSFAYNVGAGAFRKSTLLRKLNAGDSEGAASEFARWNRAGGVIIAALSRRRDAEARLFSTGDYA
jgi:lysozyme